MYEWETRGVLDDTSTFWTHYWCREVTLDHVGESAKKGCQCQTYQLTLLGGLVDTPNRVS